MRRKVRMGRSAFDAVVLLIAVLALVSQEAALASGPDRFTARARSRIPQTVAPAKKKSSVHAKEKSVVQQQVVPSSSALEPVDVFLTSKGNLVLNSIPEFRSIYGDQFASRSRSNHLTVYSIDPELQRYVSEILRRIEAPHVAVVAVEPTTGRILALANKSNTIENLALHNGFPAASLFKVVTTAAVIERIGIDPEASVSFRGGTYELERWNYLPNNRLDRRSMTIADALGKSCNAVFGRLAIAHLSPTLLRQYANSFGFNEPIGFERPLGKSAAHIPADDSFELSRTAAGFGAVSISPVHAAMMMAGIANEGVMPRPILVDKVLSPSGAVLYEAKPEALRRMVTKQTATTLLRIMQETTTTGTSRKEFMVKNRPVLNVPVAAKTGTLRGNNPKGLNHWFIAAAPADNPKIALSVIVVNARSPKARAARLGRLMIEKYLGA